jgi:hypothetical protein
MRSPPPLQLNWQRSRAKAAAAFAAYGATTLLWLALPLPVVARVAGSGAAVAAGCVLWRRISGPRALRRLTVGLDRRIAVTTSDGATRGGLILADSCVWPWATTIAWRPDETRRVRTLLVTAGNLDADEFRRLRVCLRHARAAPLGA